MMASNTFHSASISPNPRVSARPLGSRTNMVHISYVKNVLDSHMCWPSFTSFSHWYGLGVVEPFTEYDSRIHL